MQQKKRQSKKGIRDLPLTSRPREKLLLQGSENLTDEELVAILLGTGSRSYNALTLSKAFLKKYPLERLIQYPSATFPTIPGIGTAKSTKIMAALELGKRIYARESVATSIVKSTQDALVHVRDIVSKRQEFLIVLYLNARYELIQKQTVGQGGLNSIVISPKEIFSYALQTPCASVIVAHNHPSGDPTPSDDDIVFTERIQKAGEVLGITMLDHIVVGMNGFFSFRNNKKQRDIK